MKRLIPYLVFCCFIFSFSVKSFSNELFILKNKNLSPQQKKAASEYFKKVSDLIPVKIQDAIESPIEVSFESFNEGLSQLPPDKCNQSVNLVYGKTNSIGKKQIKLNQLLLLEISKGEDYSTSFNCGHKNYYRTAMATLLHETSHIYDHRRLGSTQISGQKSFYKLSDWKKNFYFKGVSKNLSQKRSVDPYEFKNLEEHFAVNFEYFILDSEYKCKRPSYYRYFAEQFETSPFINQDCRVNTEIRLDDTKAVINIAPDRVYRVDYLLASKGDEMISGFGHSMYRLIVCAPFRKTASADCLKDKLYHVVISFRANVTDIKSNPIKGLIGKYDSILFMLSFPKVIEEYNMSELRDLYSLPLNLTYDQKERFIHKTLETYWEYTGSYKFLTANCASESLDLLQSALNNHPIIKESVIKPYSLMQKLIDYGLANEDTFSNLEIAKKNSTFFESDSKLLAETKTQLFGNEKSDFIITQEPDPEEGSGQNVTRRTKKHIKEILENMPASKFQEKLDELQTADETLETRKHYMDLSILSQSTVNILQHNLDEEIGDYLEDLENDKSDLGQAIRNWNLKRKNFRLAPLKDDYGIPLKITEEDFATYKAAMELLEKTEMDLVNDVKTKYIEKVNNLMILEKVIIASRSKSKIIGMNIYLKK